MDNHRKIKKQWAAELAQRIAALSIAISILLSAAPMPISTQSSDTSLPPQTDTAPDLKFEHFTDEDFVLPAFVFDILQDHNGFMWFASSEGLYKFDGYETTVYTAEPDNPSSLSDVYISAILEDQQGNLWIGTNAGGVNRLDLSTDIITRFEHDENDPTSLSDNRIPFEVIHEDNSGAIWIGTDAGGLNRFDPDTESFTRYQHDPNNSDTISSNRVLAITSGVSKDGDDVLWVGTDVGLNRFDPGTESFIHYPHDPANANSLGNDTVYEVYQSPDSKGVWIGTKNGLDLFDPLTESFTHYQHDDNNPHSLSHNIIYGITPAEGNQLWIVTHGGGLNKFNPATGTFVRYQNNPDDPYSLSTDTLSMLYRDQAGALWVGSHGGGINKYDPTAQKFRLYQHDPDDPNSINDAGVVSIYIDRDGIAWLGSRGGLVRFDPETESFNTFQHDPDDPTSLNQNFVHDIYDDRQGVLWIGTWGAGLSIFDRHTETFTPFTLEGMTVNRSNHIFEDSQERLWVGTFDGLYRLDRARETFRYFQPRPDNPNSLSNPIIHRIFEDSTGTIWVTTNGGLNKFVPESENFIRYLPDRNDPQSLSNESVKCVAEDARGMLWFTTHIGLNKFDPNAEKFTAYFKKDGLPADRVNSIVMDDDGILWLGTGDGLSRFDPNTEEFRNYFEDDGLQGNQFGLGAATRDAQGHLYFGGAGGLNVFHPSEIKDNPNVPPVVFTRFRLFNQDVPIGPDSILPQHINNTDEIVLTYDDRIFSFEFAALSYAAPERNQYAYKMEGFDDAWRTTTADRRFATYTNLDPGEYSFRVKASNNDGVWNAEGAAIRVTVFPPWWETWWFYTLCALGVLGVFGLVYWNKASQLRTERALTRLAQENETKYRILFELFPLGITVSDPSGQILETNRIAADILGVDRETHEQRTLDGQEWRIIQPDGSLMPAEEYASVRALQENQIIAHQEMGIVKSHGDVTWIDVTAAPLPLENYGVVITYSDITERKQAEERLKASLAEKEILLRELYHRTKNTLQVVRSMLLLQASRMPENEQVQRLVHDTENRIMTIALVHQKLYQSQNLSRINIAEYIQELAYLILRSSQMPFQHTILTFAIEEIFLLLDTAIPCGLILNELLSNAIKYAFPDGREGEITIKLFRNDNGLLELYVADNGVGVPPEFDFRQQESFGLQTVIGLAEHQMQGTIQFASEHGVTYVITFPDTLYTERV